MRIFTIGFLILLQLQVYAQQATTNLPDAATVISTPDSIPIIRGKLGKFAPLVQKSKQFVLAKIETPPTRELKLLGRSALVITGVSAAGAATYAFGDEPLREFMLSNRTEVTHKISAYIEPLGRSKNMIVVTGGMYATGLALRNPRLQRAGILISSSLLINDFVTGKLKDEFQRRRPDYSDENHHFEGGEGGRNHASMPSSHTSTAFTFATSVATVYQDSKWIPPVAYSMATLVGLSRIHDNKHWATDVLAGAFVGFATAKTTNFILKQVEKQLVKKKIDIYVVPKVSNGTAGLSLGGSF